MKLEIDYPPNFAARYGYSNPDCRPIRQILEMNADNFRLFLDECEKFHRHFEQIEFERSADPRAPVWKNGWYPILDGVSLYGHIALRRPPRIIEIGSGNSTKFIRRAIDDHGLKSTVISIDPQPRTEIDNLSDEIIRMPLEETNLAVFDSVDSDDFIFFDGSHRCFQNSDVTTFFLDVLPRLPKGAVVGIHDIFWPRDYPPAWRERYYNEQYVLAAYLLGAHHASDRTGPKVVFASAYAANFLKDEVRAAIPQTLYDRWLQHRPYVGGGNFIFEVP